MCWLLNKSIKEFSPSAGLNFVNPGVVYSSMAAGSIITPSSEDATIDGRLVDILNPDILIINDGELQEKKRRCKQNLILASAGNVDVLPCDGQPTRRTQ